MSPKDDLKARKRSDYVYFLTYRTRWCVLPELNVLDASRTLNLGIERSDNDQYAHMNNSIYYHLFDSIINTYLIEHCGQAPDKSPLIGLVVSSFCEASCSRVIQRLIFFPNAAAK